MKKLLFLFLFISSLMNAQIVNIPDANFKIRLLASSATLNIAYSNGLKVKIDTNGDNEIQFSEALVIDSLNVANCNIANLEGIAAFHNLKSLDCGSNSLPYLDITAISGLRRLHCDNNQLTTIDLTQSASLEELYCSYNQVTSFNFTNSGSLKKLVCSTNALTSFNFSGLSSIEWIECNSNPLGTLDITMLGTLKRLYCSNCDLTNLSVAGLDGLEWLLCGGNPLSTINTSGLSGLQYFAMPSCQLTSLDLTGLNSIIELNCSHNQLSTLNVSAVPNLDSLFADNNVMTFIDFSASVGLRQLDLGHNLFTDIDLSHSYNLLGAVFGYNPQLIRINIKNGTHQGNDYYQDTALAFICADESEIQDALTTLSNAEIAGVVVNSYCSFEPGGNFNTISGNVTFDSDGDGCDGSDAQFPSIKVTINDGITEGVTFTDNDGHYTFYTGEGNFTITPDMENLSAFIISPLSATVSFSDSNNTDQRDFCLTSNGVHPDLEIVIAPWGQARPGFNASYRLIYKNKGNQLVSGNTSFTYNDNKLDFVSATAVPDSQDGGVLMWDFNNLMPFETRSIDITLKVNSPIETPAVNIGDVLEFSAAVNPLVGDETPADNTSALKQTVVGSFDPNEKICVEGATVSPAKIGDYLHYVINFENTGNYPAENIVVKDMIDTSKFDIASLQVLHTSHPAVTRITGNKTEFIFENINLEPNAHGSVVFKIKTKSTLASGNTVTNKADIFFDYNAPVATNTASTTFQNLGIGEHQMDNSISIFPNPVNGMLNIQSDNEIVSVSVFDVQGRITSTYLVNDSNASFDVSKYASGIYFVKVTTANGFKIQKLIKE